MNPDELLDDLTNRFPEADIKASVDKGHAVLVVPVNEIENLLKVLVEEPALKFDLFLDLTVVDWLPRQPRFDVVYHLYSTQHNHRLRLKVQLEDNQSIPSATKLWKIADWLEREMWDLYGIKFSGHPNLKRILLYEEFKGHPLRKDYPYNKRQPLIDDTWPVRQSQVKMEGLNIHRP